MDLFAGFLQYTREKHLFGADDKPVLAVSGGLDSVVLTELCHRAGLNFSIAHCNFQLRGEESQRDEDFVRQLAAKYGREVYIRRFDTLAYAAERRVSIQVAARELRYDWFRELSDQVLTAHHLDDNIETILMNFFKGTGIEGLTGMQPNRDAITRPLLFAFRSDLEEFAKTEGLQWVEDSSNASDKYTRNYIRHQVIPVLEQLYPTLRSNLGDNIERFRGIEALYSTSVSATLSDLLELKGKEPHHEWHVPVLKLKKVKQLKTIVYEMIRRYGFTASQVPAVLDLLDSGSGKYMSSGTYRILKDRNWLIISPLKTEHSEHIVITAEDRKIVFALGTLGIDFVEGGDAVRAGTGSEVDAVGVDGLAKVVEKGNALRAGAGSEGDALGADGLAKAMEKGDAVRAGAGSEGDALGGDGLVKAVDKGNALRTGTGSEGDPARVGADAGSKSARFDSDAGTAWLDADAIQWPLLLRPWRLGDYFYPLGMRKKKKLSRFFIDKKLSLAQKERVWVLEMDKKIVWVVGLRIDDRFRVENTTRRVLKLQLQRSPSA